MPRWTSVDWSCIPFGLSDAWTSAGASSHVSIGVIGGRSSAGPDRGPASGGGASAAGSKLSERLRGATRGCCSGPRGVRPEAHVWILSFTPFTGPFTASGSSLLLVGSGLDDESNRRLILRRMLPPPWYSVTGGSVRLGSGSEDSGRSAPSMPPVVETVAVGRGGGDRPADSNLEVSFADRRFLLPPHRLAGLSAGERSGPGSVRFWTTEGRVSSSFFFPSLCAEFTKPVDALRSAWMTSSLWTVSEGGATPESRVSSPCGLPLVAFGRSLASTLPGLGLESEAVLCRGSF